MFSTARGACYRPVIKQCIDFFPTAEGFWRENGCAMIAKRSRRIRASRRAAAGFSHGRLKQRFRNFRPSPGPPPKGLQVFSLNSCFFSFASASGLQQILQAVWVRVSKGALKLDLEILPILSCEKQVGQFFFPSRFEIMNAGF